MKPKICKRVCQKCWDTYLNRVDRENVDRGKKWRESFNKVHWQMGWLICVGRLSTHIDFWVEVDSEIPDECLYKFEHTVIGKAEKGDADV